LSSTTT